VELTHSCSRPVATLEHTAFAGTSLLTTAPHPPLAASRGEPATCSPEAGVRFGRAVQLRPGGRCPLPFRAHRAAGRRLEVP